MALAVRPCAGGWWELGQLSFTGPFARSSGADHDNLVSLERGRGSGVASGMEPASCGPGITLDPIRPPWGPVRPFHLEAVEGHRQMTLGTDPVPPMSLGQSP